MKHFLVLITLSMALLSCGQTDYVVKLPNGSLLPAVCDDDNEIDYPYGTKVCVKKYIGRSNYWFICTDGEMKDTTYINTYRDSTIHITEHKVGVINNHIPRM